MFTDAMLNEAELAELWRMDAQILLRMRNRHLPDPDGQELSSRTYVYRHATLDAYLAAQAKGMHVAPPTTAQLLAGEQELLTYVETAARLNVKINVVKYLIQMGDLGRILFGDKADFTNVAFITAAEIADYADRTSSKYVVDTKELAQLLGIAPKTALNVVRNPENKLETVVVRGRGSSKFVTRTSVNALLERRLCGPTTLDQWYQWVIHDTVEILDVREACRRYQISDYSLRAHLRDDDVIGLHGGNKDEWRIPVPAMELLVLQRERYTAARLVELFGVSESMTHIWLNDRALCKYNHGEAGSSCPNYWCVEDFVSRHLTSPGTAAAKHWLHERVQPSAEPLMSLNDLHPWGASPEVIEAAVRDGVLEGIWLPNSLGELALHTTYGGAQAFMRQQDRKYCMQAQTLRSHMTLAA